MNDGWHRQRNGIIYVIMGGGGGDLQPQRVHVCSYGVAVHVHGGYTAPRRCDAMRCDTMGCDVMRCLQNWQVYSVTLANEYHYAFFSVAPSSPSASADGEPSTTPHTARWRIFDRNDQQRDEFLLISRTPRT